MNVALERNRDFNEGELPYFARVEIVKATADIGRIYRIPIRVRYQGLNKEFWLEICGFRLNTRHPGQLPSLIVSLMRGLVNARRLPTYVFIARRARAVFPVYTLRDEVFVVAPSGPVFRHVELAKVREYLTDYLHEVGILGKMGQSDKLHVRGIARVDLSLRRPVFYLKKRVPGEADFWAPVFESGDGRQLYVYAASQRHEVTKSAGEEVDQLRHLVAAALINDGRLQKKDDLRADRLLPSYWEQVARLIEPVAVEQLAQRPIRYYKMTDSFVAMEPRPDEGRFGLFNGDTLAAVKQRVRRDLARRQG